MANPLYAALYDKKNCAGVFETLKAMAHGLCALINAGEGESESAEKLRDLMTDIYTGLTPVGQVELKQLQAGWLAEAKKEKASAAAESVVGDYTVVCGGDLEYFIKWVKERMAQGWVCQGGISVHSGRMVAKPDGSQEEHGWHYFQSMTRFKV